ncbi:MAG: hypothetical protein ACKOA5_07520 [Actinomycetota bacterium]
MKRCLGLVVVSLAGLDASSVSALPSATQSVIAEVSSATATVGTLKVVETVDGIERVVLGPVPARVGRNGVKRD